ncbi:MoaD/ThiS family protein [Namhaeicola litoreus]|uniref:Molybdopterin synthase sulfur carrier subunit n=1 Tax=Namhaeicola litoreus TaxID=1052145 RepID=A0ABW3Y1H1_9FLAO
MKIKTLFFGVARDIVGKDELLIDVQGNTTIQDFEARLLNQYPDFSDIRNFAFAVNESYVDRNYSIQKNDLIAVLPPVSGG